MSGKILIVFGTRPEAIKMAPVVRELGRHRDLQAEVCVTGQHREMLDGVLHLFEIEPDHDLDVMAPGQTLYDVTSKVLSGMGEVLRISRPDLVLVHGDTTTSTSAALAAFYERIPVGHVEAGLRTGDIYSPWPEEMNRLLTGRLASYHFAPTEQSAANLRRENIPGDRVFITGNTVIDALQHVVARIQNCDVNPDIDEQLVGHGVPAGLYDAWKEGRRDLVLVTGHRRENFGQGFLEICDAIGDLAQRHEGTDFLYPVHLNPNVREVIYGRFGSNGTPLENVLLAEPMDYVPFVALMSACRVVLTDSGGVQEEAPGLGKPVLVMRDTTERPEAVSSGTVKLVGTDRKAIFNHVDELLSDVEAYEAMASAVNPYGDGRAAPRIVRHCLDLLHGTD